MKNFLIRSFLFLSLLFSAGLNAQITLSGVTVSGVSINASAAYDADYQALLDYYTANALAHPSTAKKTVENAFMIAYKAAFGAATIAATPTLQMLMFKTDAASGASLVNWVNPGTRNATNSGATFTSDLGWNSSGTPNYIISGLNGTDLNQSDFTILIRAYTNAQDNNLITGCGDGTASQAEALLITPRSTGNTVAFRAISNANTNISAANSDATVRVAFGRTDGSNVHHAIDGAAFTNTASTVNAQETTRDISILAFTGSTVTNYYTQGISYRIVTSRKLTDGENAAIDAALANYLL